MKLNFKNRGNVFLGSLMAGALLGASTVPASAALVHLYEFNSNLNDSIGSLSLTSNGGTLNATSLSFDVNEGPSLDTSSAITSVYSVGLRFSFDDVSGYRKIVDFKNKTSDNGQYNLSSKLNFYPVLGGPDSFTAGDTVDVVFTRDGSGTYTAYLNGVSQYSFDDSGSVDAVATGGLFHFFQDDAATSFSEASAGVVHEIRIWDSALTAGQVPDAFAPVPEPSTYVAGVMLLLPFGVQLLKRFRPRAKLQI